jgi:spore maturation protein CgeB
MTQQTQYNIRINLGFKSGEEYTAKEISQENQQEADFNLSNLLYKDRTQEIKEILNNDFL